MRLQASMMVVALLASGCATGSTGGFERDMLERELVELNRQLLNEQIVSRDAALFNQVALDQFLVVAPGGRIEDKMQSVAGVSAFDVRGIEVGDEQVTVAGNTAVLVGRLRIDGEMQPVGKLPPMKFMAVFVQEKSMWRLLARSLTPCFPITIERGFC